MHQCYQQIYYMTNVPKPLKYVKIYTVKRRIFIDIIIKKCFISLSMFSYIEKKA